MVCTKIHVIFYCDISQNYYEFYNKTLEACQILNYEWLRLKITNQFSIDLHKPMTDELVTLFSSSLVPVRNQW